MIALTMGEPAGVGPDIILKLWQSHPSLFANDQLCVLGNADVLLERAALLGIDFSLDRFPLLHFPLSAPCTPQKLSVKNAQFVVDVLTHATQQALQKKYRAIVTAPIHKGILNEAGFSYKGHTDFFSSMTNQKTIMMMQNKEMRIVLFTDHMPLKAVSNALTQEKLRDFFNLLIRECKDKLNVSNPPIIVCGLNPHAGENGYLGTEEKEIMIPVIQEFQKKGCLITGPIGADVAFLNPRGEDAASLSTRALREASDHRASPIIVTMYHDQGLPVIKYAGFYDAINVTLGLPFLRTSVDHGTALDIAGTGKARCDSLLHALHFALHHT